MERFLGRQITTLFAACGLVAGTVTGVTATISHPQVAGAQGNITRAGVWHVLGAAGSLTTLNGPAALAVGPRGNIYISDTGRHSIVEVSPNGHRLAEFAAGDLTSLGASSLAVNAAGTVYAADSLRAAILVYSAAHRRIAEWPIARPGAAGVPLAVAIGGGGTVIVAAAPGSRCTIPYAPTVCATGYVVERRTFAGRLLSQFRTSAARLGVTRGVITQVSVAVNAGRNVTVLASGVEPCYRDCRIFHFLIEHGPGGGILGRWGTDQLDRTANWTALASAGRGRLALADDFNHRIEQRGPGGRILARWSIGGIPPSPQECSSEPLAVWQDSDCRRAALGPSGVAVAGNGTVYASDSGANRIVVLSARGRLLAQWGAGGSAPDRFWFPAGVAVDSRGAIWVNDMANGRVQSLGADGHFHVRFATPGAGTGMALDGQDNLYIGQQSTNLGVVVSKFSPDGTLLARWGNLHLADPPSGVVVTPRGEVVIIGVAFYWNPQQVDLDGSTIMRLSPTGKQLTSIHLGYFGPGSGIAVDANENITVAYGTTAHIERFSPSGQRLSTWGAPRPVMVQWGFPSPAAIAFDTSGNLYMADTMQNAVREYGADGSLLHTWGGAGSDAGQFQHPGGIAVAPDGTVYVSDTENQRVQRLQR